MAWVVSVVSETWKGHTDSPCEAKIKQRDDTRPSWSTRCGAIAYRRALFGG